MKTTILDILGVIFLASFAYFLWPPAPLLVLGAAFLLISWRSTSTPTQRPPAGGDS